jgi:hypothetical protein
MLLPRKCEMVRVLPKVLPGGENGLAVVATTSKIFSIKVLDNDKNHTLIRTFGELLPRAPKTVVCINSRARSTEPSRRIDP